MPVISDTLDDMQQFFALGSTRQQGISVDQELCKSFADALDEIRDTVRTAEAVLISRAVLAEMPEKVEHFNCRCTLPGDEPIGGYGGYNVIPFRPRQRPAFCDGRGGGGAA